jgi:autotransporter-associated beta strand protein
VEIDNAATELTLTGGLSGSAEFNKLGPGTLTLATANSFSGYAVVQAGTLKLSAAGALGQATRIDLYGTLLLAGSGNRIGDTTELVTFGGGVLSMAGLSNQSEAIGFLSVSGAFSESIDFGAGSGDSLLFGGIYNNLNTLNILNWSGTPGVLGTASSDRLIFTGVPSDFTSLFSQGEVSFNGMTGYVALPIDATHYEVVAVPEPSASGLALAGTLLALLRWRPRRATRRA